MKKRISLFMLPVLLLISLFASSAALVHATGSLFLLGGMNLNAYCVSQGDQASSVAVNGTWSCIPSGTAINMTAACQWQYSDTNAIAQQDRPGDPYSWNCYSTTQPGGTPTNLGGMTLDAYCTSIAEGYSYIDGQAWFCTGNGQPINMNSACIWQYNIANAYAQQTILGNIYSYNCFEPAAGTTPTPTPTATPTPTVTPSPSPTPTITPIPGDDWATYLYGASRSSYNTNESVINTKTAANIKQHWDITTAKPISIQPAVVGNVVYWGDWSGNFHATDLSGNSIWTVNLGVDTPPAANNCNPPSLGVASSASVRTISVNGVQTPIVYVGGGDGYMYALYASNGKVLWKTKLTDITTGGFVWSSPAEAGGDVFVGVASLGDCPLVQGLLYKLNWRLGTVDAEAKLVPNGCVGAGVWSSPTIDQGNNRVYVTTGTQDNSCKVNGQPFFEPNGIAVVELDINLNVLGSWRIPPAQQGPDSDFGVSPALTTAVINGVTTQLVSAANKNGYLYTFKRDAISAGPIWFDQMGAGGTCPDCGNGSISTAATDGHTLYQGTGSTTVNGINYKATVVAVNPATGAYIWQHGFAHAVVGAITLIKGVVIVPEGNHIDLINAANGNEIKQLTPPGANSVFDAPVAVASGMLFAGDLNGNLYEFGL